MASRQSEGGEYQKINQVKLNCFIIRIDIEGKLQFRKDDMQTVFANMMDPLTLVKTWLLEDLRENPDDLQWNIVFDEMYVEDEATPTGLGMVDGDTIGLHYRSYVAKSFSHELEKLFTKTKRTANIISVGLNVVVGESEGGLPLSQQKLHAPQCEEQLRNLRTALLPALR